VNEREPFDLQYDPKVLRKKDAVVLAAQIRPRKRGNGKGRGGIYNRLTKSTLQTKSIQDYDHICEINGVTTPKEQTAIYDKILTISLWYF
jgi:hypothetical protein